MRLALFSSILVGTRIRKALTLFDWAATGPRFHVLLIPSSQTLNGLKDEEGKQKDLLTRYDSLHCRKRVQKKQSSKLAKSQAAGRPMKRKRTKVQRTELDFLVKWKYKDSRAASNRPRTTRTRTVDDHRVRGPAPAASATPLAGTDC